MTPSIATRIPLLFDSLTDAADGLDSRRFSCVELVENCLRRIEQLDGSIRAWVMVDAQGAIAAARSADDRRSAGKPLSRLDGVPFGVKDIIDVAGWPTVAGFEPWRNRVAENDAAIVAYLKRSGLIPLGKTVTTQFASIDPPRTRNPWNLDRTPGGSSSGSCAAVACRMVPLALGSQTGGSINRPASFCGVVGMKMAYGFDKNSCRIHQWGVEGVVPCSPSLDTLGPIVATIDDLTLLIKELESPSGMTLRLQAFLRAAMVFDRHATSESPAGLISPSLDANRDRFRVIRLNGRFRDLADEEMNAAVDEAESRLSRMGIPVESSDACDAIFDESFWEVHRIVMMTECFRTHRETFANHAEAYAPKIRGWVETGRDLEENQPDRVRWAVDQRKVLTDRFFDSARNALAVLVPAARGEAPGPDTTGDPVMNSPWTLLGMPSLTIPMGLSRSGMPLGVQLASVRSHEAEGGPGWIIALGKVISA